MRTYTPLVDDRTKKMLGMLADQNTSVQNYREAMTVLGQQLAVQVASKVPKGTPICVVCTVEDADFLAKGLLEGFAESGVDTNNIKLVCFWNERVRRFRGNSENSFDVAPIIKEYREKIDVDKAVLVVVKSIISGACVVKTNLATLIDKVLPRKIFVASPVMRLGAEKRLSSEFPAATSSRFEYLTFAIDDEMGDGENVIPGIGGSVYERLGFENRLSYVPDIVKARRRAAAY